MFYEKEEIISFYDLDANGDVKLTALLKYMNEAAFYNAEKLGIGFDKTVEFGLVFVIQRIGIRLFKAPELNQKVTVRTWPGETTRSIFKRYGDLRDENGNKLIEWESLWVLIDIEARKIKRPSALPIEIPQYGKEDVAVEARKIILPEERESCASYDHTVKFNELDINMHMNNAIYADLIANVLALTASPPIRTWSEIHFNYVHEAKLGDQVVVSCDQVAGSLHVTGSCGEKTIFTATIDYEQREE